MLDAAISQLPEAVAGAIASTTPAGAPRSLRPVTHAAAPRSRRSPTWSTSPTDRTGPADRAPRAPPSRRAKFVVPVRNPPVSGSLHRRRRRPGRSRRSHARSRPCRGPHRPAQGVRSRTDALQRLRRDRRVDGPGLLGRGPRRMVPATPLPGALTAANPKRLRWQPWHNPAPAHPLRPPLDHRTPRRLAHHARSARRAPTHRHALLTHHKSRHTQTKDWFRLRRNRRRTTDHPSHEQTPTRITPPPTPPHQQCPTHRHINSHERSGLAGHCPTLHCCTGGRSGPARRIDRSPTRPKPVLQADLTLLETAACGALYLGDTVDHSPSNSGLRSCDADHR